MLKGVAWQGMLKGHRDHYVHTCHCDCSRMLRYFFNFLSRMGTTVLGPWHQMLRCDRKSSAVLETDERCG